MSGVARLRLRKGGVAPPPALQYIATEDAAPLDQIGGTFARASTGSVTDYDGNALTALANELREAGKRRVENLLASSERNDLNSTVSNASRTATVVTLSGTNNAYWYKNCGPFTSGDSFVCSMTISCDTERLIGIRAVRANAGTNDVKVVISAGPVAQRVSLALTLTGDGTLEFGLENRSGVVAGVDTSPGVFTVQWVQVERVPSGQTEPSEYVSKGVLSSPYHGWGADGVSYFPTDGSGDPLDTIKGFLASTDDLWTVPAGPHEEATVVVQYEYPTGGNDGCVFSLHDSASASDDAIVFNADALTAVVSVGGVEQTSATDDGTNTGTHTVALIVSAGSLALRVDSGEWQTDSGGTLPSFDTLQIGGAGGDASANLGGTIKAIAVFDAALSHAQARRVMATLAPAESEPEPDGLFAWGDSSLIYGDDNLVWG